MCAAPGSRWDGASRRCLLGFAGQGSTGRAEPGAVPGPSLAFPRLPWSRPRGSGLGGAGSGCCGGCPVRKERGEGSGGSLQQRPLWPRCCSRLGAPALSCWSISSCMEAEQPSISRCISVSLHKPTAGTGKGARSSPGSAWRRCRAPGAAAAASDSACSGSATNRIRPGAFRGGAMGPGCGD